MKILITGSSGMLGSDLVEVLSRDFEVFGITRHSASLYSTRHKTICLDLIDQAVLRREILKVKPDVVIHAAAFTKVDVCEDEGQKAFVLKQNTEIVKNLIHICNESGAFLIFFSTDYVFNGQKKEPYLEDDAIHPVNFYGQTKAWAEEALIKESERFIIFRVTWLYGIHGNHFPKAILKQAQEKNELSVVSDQWGRPTWTRDIAIALHLLLTSRKNLLDQYNKQIFHIGNSGQVNWSGYARKILDSKGFSNVAVSEISSSQLSRPAKRPLNSVLNLDKSERCLGIKMRPWDEAMSSFLKELD